MLDKQEQYCHSQKVSMEICLGRIVQVMILGNDADVADADEDADADTDADEEDMKVHCASDDIGKCRDG